MPDHYSFKFVDDKLNGQLIALLERSGVRHAVAEDATIRYSAQDEELVGNELIPAIRGEEFPSWQILCCPADWVERYKTYMREHRISFLEEIMDGEVQFLISLRCRPHSWQLENANALASHKSLSEELE